MLNTHFQYFLILRYFMYQSSQLFFLVSLHSFVTIARFSFLVGQVRVLAEFFFRWFFSLCMLYGFHHSSNISRCSDDTWLHESPCWLQTKIRLEDQHRLKKRFFGWLLQSFLFFLLNIVPLELRVELEFFNSIRQRKLWDPPTESWASLQEICLEGMLYIAMSSTEECLDLSGRNREKVG